MAKSFGRGRRLQLQQSIQTSFQTPLERLCSKASVHSDTRQSPHESRSGHRCDRVLYQLSTKPARMSNPNEFSGAYPEPRDALIARLTALYPHLMDVELEAFGL